MSVYLNAFLEKTIKDRVLKQIAVCRESFRIGFKTI